MVKKAIALMGAGALLLSAAMPALGFWPMPSDDVSIVNWGMASNVVSTSANTGGNSVGGSRRPGKPCGRPMMGMGGMIMSGNASARATVSNVVNDNVVTCDGVTAGILK